MPSDYSPFREAMVGEFLDSLLLTAAQRYALQYLAESGERNVFPTAEAIAALKAFEEALPQQTGDAGGPDSRERPAHHQA